MPEEPSKSPTSPLSANSPQPDSEPARNPAETEAEESPKASSERNGKMPITTVLLAATLVLLVALIVVNIQRRKIDQTVRESDLSVAKADLEAYRTYLNRQRAEMGLTPLQTEGEPIEKIADRMKKDAETLVLLTTRFQEMLTEKDAVLSGKTAELVRSEQMRQSLLQETSRLQSELQRALAESSEADLLRRSQEQMRNQRDALTAELSKVRSELAARGQMASADDLADLQRRLDETSKAKEFYERRVAELEAELAKGRLFAKSENELLPAAVELFRNLRGLEDQKDSDLTSAYSKLGVDLGANVLRTLDFQTGSSVVPPDDESAIRELTSEVPDGDLILVIGYASETGNEEANQKLSSDRATAVAELISGIKRQDQKVQAVYLGQTDRFSSRIPERNQICEIWRVRQK
ncbi:MAG: OmpA family protein [Luteolibacter sp.]